MPGFYAEEIERLMFSSAYRVIALVVVLVGAAAFTGCSATPTKQTLSDADRAHLEQRVRDRWQTLVEKDFAQTWEYSTPTYRALFPKRMFVHQFSYTVDWQLTGVKIVNYDADAAVASVAVRVMSKPTKQTAISAEFGALPSTIEESWILVDGEWWYSANT
jgi:hypothetical protein